MGVTVSNIQLEPVDVFFGSRSIDTVTTVADVADSLDSTFFLIKSAGNAITYEVNIITSGSAVLVTAGATLVEVLVGTGATAADVATAIKAALDLLVDFSASIGSSTDEVVVTRSLPGVSDASVDGSAATSFTFVQDATGDGGDLGATEGVEFSLEFEDVEVTADQTGGQILDLINRASAVSVNATFKELTKDFWTTVLGNSRGSVTGTGATAQIGVGDDKLFLNQSQFAKELVLKPINLASNDRNYHFWQTIPNPSGPNLDGSDLSTADVEFIAIRDASRQNNKNMFLFGDGKSGFLK